MAKAPSAHECFMAAHGQTVKLARRKIEDLVNKDLLDDLNRLKEKLQEQSLQEKIEDRSCNEKE